MIKAVISDFSRVLLFPVDQNYEGSLNALNNSLLTENPDYDFWKYFVLNRDLLKYYSSLQVPVYIFTSELIQNHPAIKDELQATFKGVLSAKELGGDKANPKAYEYLAEKLQLRPEKITYIDDQQVNIIAAQNAGFSTVLYGSNKDVVDKII